MSQRTQLVIFFRCQHKETSTINFDHSTQQNRNLWSRVKEWSSTSPDETKYQQSSSLCTRCLETEKKQIQEATALQSRMAANAARQFAAQNRLLAAPPTQGVSATIAALALPGDKTAIQTLRRTQSLIHHQRELEIVDQDWQGHSAGAAQRDLHRVVTFWEKHHSEHAGRATGASSSGPRSCAECKKIEISLGDPVFRRQAGLSDIKLKNGVWYGTDGMEDPWSAIKSFGSVTELVTKSPKIKLDENSSIKPVEPQNTSLPKTPVPVKILQPEIVSHKSKPENANPSKPWDTPFTIPEDTIINPDQAKIIYPSEKCGKYLPKLESFAKIQDLSSREPVHKFPDQGNLEIPQSKSPRDDWLDEHRRTMKDLRIENLRRMGHLRKSQIQQALPLAADTMAENPLPTPQASSTPTPETPTSGTETLILRPRVLLRPHQYVRDTSPFPPQFPDRPSRRQRASEIMITAQKLAYRGTRNRASSTKRKYHPLETTLPLPDSMTVMSEIRPHPAERVALPPQEEKEIEILEWYDRFQEQNSYLPGLPQQIYEEFADLSEREFRHEKVSARVPDEDIVLQHQHSTYQPLTQPLQAEIDPSSPLGIQAVQKIRDYFHIPSSIPASGFQEFWSARPKLRRGMTEARTLASYASTHRRPTSYAKVPGPSDLLEEVPDWFFGDNVFLMRSSDVDIEKRVEISNLCDRIMWTKDEDADGAVSEWEQSDDEDGGSDEEGERKRQAAVDAISGDIPNAQLDSPLEFAFDAAFAAMTPRPKTPRSNLLGSLEDLRDTLQPIAHSPSYADSDLDSNAVSDSSSHSDDEDSVCRTRITSISAPILEDPASQHNVIVRSLLRSEVVLVN